MVADDVIIRRDNVVESRRGSVGDLNSKLKDDANPQDGVVQLRNLMDAIIAGSVDAQVDVVVRETTQSITKQGAGEDAAYNLK